ncbi:putative aminoacrylate hydrolase RutD [Methanimicrococcus sp. At1]|uniref:Aminoacrylate hydrolase RutD n=1 Tax=Methanimicrococcus hacksteinii TaxID=3028293 RepID=A0ABU3VRV0_9EURY|nr:alpha/beta hydrolase [Methanimicrococcus sp. At1]MDV0446152.1 putative aminoacrylate hydrolase RutD [Methanimicrococcus sp. At1]
MNITVNGVSLFYKITGEGSPLLLLHGNGEDHTIFNELAAKLAADFTVYAVDSRNQGQSQKTDDYSYETMAEDFYAFIQALNLGKINLAGFSDGAIIGLLLAIKHNEVIEKMALLGVNLKPDDFTEESYQYIKDTYEETKDPLFKLMLEQPDIDLDDVRNIDIPTLIIAADNDIFKPDSFTQLAEALPNAKLKIMIGHDHSSYITNQDILYPDLIQFFK